MKKIVGLVGFMLIALILSFAPIEDNKYSEENTVLPPDCVERYDQCDALATLLGAINNLTYEEEYGIFDYCMVNGDC